MIHRADGVACSGRWEIEGTIDWDSPYAVGISPDTFDMLLADTLYALELKNRLYVLDRSNGAYPAYALPVTAIMHNALAGLFMDNMFRSALRNPATSCFGDLPFYLLVTQFDKLDPERYAGRCRTLENGTTSRMAVALVFHRRIGIVFGYSYMATIKKLLFTAMMISYTSKLAGTETGVAEPQAVFSRFFGALFMLGTPADCTRLLERRLEGHGTRLFLINTGWSGGPCGTNHRIDIELTRAMVRAAVSGELEEAAYHTDPIFGMQVPASCPEFPSDILFPASTWADRAAYERGAAKLAG
ncbi:MAG: phosphoenolpyruvate carboxykinase (ATP) [Spirochaetaceae bacterium]